MTIIAFVGSVFSPYYARARRRGPAAALDHCAVNVAIYGRDRRAWVFTEHPRAAVERAADRLRIGASTIAWEGDRLRVTIDEREATLGRRLRGEVILTPSALHGEPVEIGAAGRHRWIPIAPHARIDVVVDGPAPVAFTGAGYHDANVGDEPLEDGFVAWNWSRVSDARETVVLYEGQRRGGDRFHFGRAFAADGGSRAIDAPRSIDLGRSAWRVARSTRADAGGDATILRTLEDAPFYARAELAAELGGARRIGVHEAVDLDRFASPLVQHLLTYKTRRARG